MSSTRTVFPYPQVEAAGGRRADASRPAPPGASTACTGSRSSPPTRSAPLCCCEYASPLFPAELVPGTSSVRSACTRPRHGARWVIELLAVVDRWLESVPLPCANVNYGGRSYLIRSSLNVTQFVGDRTGDCDHRLGGARMDSLQPEVSTPALSPEVPVLPSVESPRQRLARHGHRVGLYAGAVVFVALLAVLVVLTTREHGGGQAGLGDRVDPRLSRLDHPRRRSDRLAARPHDGRRLPPQNAPAVSLKTGLSVRLRAVLVLLAVAVIVSAVVLFAEYRGPAPSGCRHRISSAKPVTVVGGKNAGHKTYAKACLL